MARHKSDIGGFMFLAAAGVAGLALYQHFQSQIQAGLNLLPGGSPSPSPTPTPAPAPVQFPSLTVPNASGLYFDVNSGAYDLGAPLVLTNSPAPSAPEVLYPSLVTPNASGLYFDINTGLYDLPEPMVLAPAVNVAVPTPTPTPVPTPTPTPTPTGHRLPIPADLQAPNAAGLYYDLNTGQYDLAAPMMSTGPALITLPVNIGHHPPGSA